jgi:hypothetical protein
MRSIISAANKTWLVFLVLLVGLASSPIFAATTGSISGTVKDAQGAVVQAATVQLQNEATGVVLTVQTDPAGFYNFPSLTIGIYDVTFEKDGFEKFVQTKVVIDIDTEQRVDAALKVGSTSEQITVISTEAQVDTENAELGDVITGKEMADMPISSRSYTDLLALQPGAVNISVSQYGSIQPDFNGNNGEISIGGAQDVHSGFMVNGANTVDGLGEGTFLLPVMDSIAEFRIVTNNAGAEYGGYAGAVTNVVTKSGTNQFHGDAFEYLSETFLNASDFFTHTTNPYQQSIFGGTVGGPVLRKKVFFFVDYQGTRQSSNNQILAQAPTSADITGNLADRAANLSGSVIGPYFAQVLNQRLGLPAGTITSGEPYYTPGCIQTSQCVFPSAVIPKAAWSPVSANVLALFPTSNTTLINGLPGFTAQAAQNTQTDNKGGFRGDVSTRFGAVSGYYHYDPWSLFQPPGYGTSVPGFPQITSGKAQLWVASLRTTFGSTAVNAFTASYTRNSNVQGLTTFDGKSLASLGFDTNVADGGIFQVVPAQYQNFPTVNISNLGGVGPSLGSIISQHNNVYGGADDFTKIVGTHSLQFGAQYHWDQVDLDHPLNGGNGSFSFNGRETGDGLADMLIGAPTSWSQGAPAGLNLRNFYAGIYAEDSWRANKNLTLNYGVRWEVDPFWREEHNLNPVVLPGLQSTQFPTAPLGYVFPGDAGVPEHLSFINWHDFGPRLGAAYSPDFSNGLLRSIFGGLGKSSIRAGYGMHYTNIEGYNDYNLAAPPTSAYNPINQPVMFEQPFLLRQTGALLPNPFPIAPLSDDKTYNFSKYMPFKTYRNPLLHSPSPYEEHVELSVERALTSKTLLSLSYDGTFGHHLTVTADQNPASPALCLSVSQQSQVAPGSPTCGPGGEEQVYTTVGGQVIDTTRIGALGPNFKDEGLELNVGNSAYNALFATLRYTTDRLNFAVKYTLSKAMDNGSGRGDQIFFNGDRNFFRCESDYDSRNNFTANYTYELPFDKLFRHDDRLTRGWKVSGITQFEQGVPVIMQDEYSDSSEVGDQGASAWSETTNMPVYTPGNIVGDHNPRHGNPWFNINLFSPAAPGQQGNSPRRFFAGPGSNNTNISLIKAVKITEHTSAEFDAVFNNAFNHVSFAGLYSVDGEIGDQGGPFGTIGGDNGPRSGVFVMKFNF